MSKQEGDCLFGGVLMFISGIGLEISWGEIQRSRISFFHIEYSSRTFVPPNSPPRTYSSRIKFLDSARIDEAARRFNAKPREPGLVIDEDDDINYNKLTELTEDEKEFLEDIGGDWSILPRELGGEKETLSIPGIPGENEVGMV